MQKKLIIYGISLFMVQASYAMEQIQEQFSLHDIVERDDIGTLNTLLRDPHVDVNVADSLSDYPLHIAVRRKNIPMVQTLLDHNASADKSNAYGWTPLHVAILKETWSMIPLLLTWTRNLNMQDKDGNTVLLSALMRRIVSQATVFSLLDRSPDVNIVNKDGTSPLHCAIRKSLPDIVERLLQLNANPNAQDAGGNTALHLALNAEKDNHEIFDALFKGPSACRPIVNIENQAHDRALHIAVRRGMPDEARKLLAEGADPNLQDAAGYTALHLALVNRNFDFEFIERLMQRFARINIVGHNSSLPLHLAITNRRLEEVTLLLKYATDCGNLEASTISGTQDTIFSAQDAAGNTPLHLALARKDISIELVQLLLTHIASLPTQEKLAALSTQDAAGNTPLHLALARGDVSIELIQLLLNNIASLPTQEKLAALSAKDANDNTLLHLVLARVDISIELIQLLLNNIATLATQEKMAALSAKNTAGNTPLHLALARGDVSIELIQLLLNNIASLPTEKKLETIDAQDVNGNTPLHLAALITGQNKDLALEIINVLLHNGAGTRISNRNGQEACDLVPEDYPEIKYLVNTFWRNRAIQFWAALKAVKNGTIYCTKVLMSPIARLFGYGDQEQNKETAEQPLNGEETNLLQTAAEKQGSGGWCTVM